MSNVIANWEKKCWKLGLVIFYNRPTIAMTKNDSKFKTNMSLIKL